MDSVLASPTDIYAGLAEADWTFSTRLCQHAVEAVHPYPAKFISDIPSALIRALPVPDGTTVFDPFCGSGSTLVEAQRAGLSSVGIDLNPIACLISRVKTSPYPQGFADAGARVAERARGMTSPTVPSLPNLDHWFGVAVQIALAALVQAIDAEVSDTNVDALRLALSRIVVRVSRQESDTRYAAIEKRISSDDVFAAYQAAVVDIDRALLARDWALQPCHIVEADILAATRGDIGLEPVGLVVTSPPYPNAYEYWLYHKYRMWWLGFDPIAVKTKEIGARAHFFGASRHTAETFEQQMAVTFALIDEALVPGGHACFVVGRSKIHGQIVDNANTLRKLAASLRYAEVLDVERPLNSRRKSFNLSHANIRTEFVLAFRKPR